MSNLTRDEEWISIFIITFDKIEFSDAVDVVTRERRWNEK